MAAAVLQPEIFEKPPRLEFRLSLLFAAIFVPIGFHLPYFPLWLESRGLSATEIGFVLSAPMFLRVVTTPLITTLADMVRDRAHMLVTVVTASTILSLGYLFHPGYFLILLISLALQIVWTPQAPLVDSLALSGIRRFDIDYAGIRKWGSAAFLLANLTGGVLLSYVGTSAVPLIVSGGLALALATSLFAPRMGRPRQASPLSATGIRDAAPSLLNRPFLLVAVGAGIINASHGLLFGFGTIYWQSIGIEGGVIGALWAFAVVAEIALMMMFRRVFGRFSAPAVLVVAGLASAVRWAIFPLIVPAGGGAGAFFALQSLHAFSTGLLLVGVPKMIAETIGEERLGAAQGVVFFANGLSMAIVTLLSGPIYEAIGAAGFYLMAGVALIGVVPIAAIFLSPTAAGRVATRANRHR